MVSWCATLPWAGAAAVDRPAQPEQAETSTGAADARDGEFVDSAARGGIYGMQLARLAAARAEDSAVREFAQQMTVENYDMNAALAYLTHVKRLSPATSLLPAQERKLAELSRVEPAAFDGAWIATAIEEHESTLAAFAEQAKSGRDPDLKDWAEEVVPVLENHIAAAEVVARKLGQ